MPLTRLPDNAYQRGEVDVQMRSMQGDYLSGKNVRTDYNTPHDQEDKESSYSEMMEYRKTESYPQPTSDSRKNDKNTLGSMLKTAKKKPSITVNIHYDKLPEKSWTNPNEFLATEQPTTKQPTTNLNSDAVTEQNQVYRETTTFNNVNNGEDSYIPKIFQHYEEGDDMQSTKEDTTSETTEATTVGYMRKWRNFFENNNFTTVMKTPDEVLVRRKRLVTKEVVFGGDRYPMMGPTQELEAFNAGSSSAAANLLKTLEDDIQSDAVIEPRLTTKSVHKHEENFKISVTESAHNHDKSE